MRRVALVGLAVVAMLAFGAGSSEATVLISTDFGDIDCYYDRLEMQLKDKETLFLTYENDLQDNPLAGYYKVCDFLGFECEEPTVIMQRTNPFALSETIENYDEVCESLQPTQYAWMLE